MKILLVYPRCPETFWSYKRALKFVSKKSATPPLGLLTVAALLPASWQKKLIDMNVSRLTNKDIQWADYVFISAMSVQKQSAKEVITRCQQSGVATVAGGPLFTTGYDDFPTVDHLVLNEAEITLPMFINDLKSGCLKRIYTSSKWADITTTPIPDWNLLQIKKYASMVIQHSRGCPFNCDFCDITLLYGKKTRTKTPEQVITELETIYRAGWRENVFFVDDNFIGNKKTIKQETLPAIINWMRQNNRPFTFNTQVSINIADDEELLSLMAEAGFDNVFIGIESTHDESLHECSKTQNRGRNLIDCIQKIRHYGLEVQGGFIVGFDNDPETIFDDLINFIQKSAIVTAMVGILNALKGTTLYHRLDSENRLLKEETGNNTDCSINFRPRMNFQVLREGYKKVVKTIYAPKHYYQRIMHFLAEYSPPAKKMFTFRPVHIAAFFKSVFYLGIIGKERFYYWKLMFWTMFRRPECFSLAATLAIYGFHYRKVFARIS